MAWDTSVSKIFDFENTTDATTIARCASFNLSLVDLVGHWDSFKQQGGSSAVHEYSYEPRTS